MVESDKCTVCGAKLVEFPGGKACPKGLHVQNEIRIHDHGSHRKEIELELVIKDTYIQRSIARQNPSINYWQQLAENQDKPITLTLNGFWIQSISQEPSFDNRGTEQYVTRVRLVGKGVTIE